MTRPATDWLDRAKCAALGATITADRDPFFLPDVVRGQVAHRQSGKTARWYCARCPVTAECLAYALRNNVRHGIWAGLDAADLIRMRQETA